ncbi:MAG: histone deacetylase [Armatimonadetes bacterium]|nr:MAG: histone deacetylase [Armatimonadota bacterium]
MTVHLVTNDLSLRHTTPPGHPERPERVTAVIDAIRSSDYDVVDLEAPAVDMELLSTIHAPEYIDRVRAFCVAGGGALDPDTYAVPASWDAAIHAAGAGSVAVDRLSKRTGSAFVAVRPPGHHAERHQAMGFCLFNNVAVTASYLRASGERVAIVDWDVHHGNGTQRSFYEDPDILYVSLHEFPFYPGTGWVDEVGTGAGRGMTVNIPIPAATSADSYLAAFDQIAMPPIRQFDPSWILISSGFDAHVRDPLGGLKLESIHYGWMASALASVVPPNRIVSFLEGGYDLSALGTGAVATLDGVTGGTDPVVWPSDISGSAARTVDMARESTAIYWDL